MSKKIKVGIVGLGRAGWNLHFLPMKEHSDFEIVAVADPEPARTGEAAELTGCAEYKGLEELLTHQELDAVVVATPSSLHYHDAKKVLQSGRHCILEKPMATSFAEAKELHELAQAKNVQICVHHQHCFKDEYHHLKEIIASGVLGDIFQINVFWAYYGRRWDWQTLKVNGGGQLNNTCPHTLSIVLPLLGSPVEAVTADLRNIKDAGDSEDHVHLWLRTKSGIVADITVTSACALPAKKWMLLGTCGTLSSDGAMSKLRYYNKDEAPELKLLETTTVPDRKYLSEQLPWKETECPTKAKAALVQFHDNVAAVLRGEAAPVVSSESAVEVMRVIELARKSAESGKTILD